MFVMTNAATSKFHPELFHVMLIETLPFDNSPLLFI